MKKSTRPKLQSEHQKLVAWAASHGLSISDLRRLRISRVAQPEASKLLGFDAPAGGMKIPYPNLSGDSTDFFRLRFDDYPTFGQKAMRYRQPGPGVRAYFPQLTDWLRIASSTSVPILFTEGELKAACSTKNGLPCIGIGGVTMWHKRGVHDLLPDLAPFAFDDRTVAIVFDSDALTNPQVRAQETALAAVLIGRGARVKIVRLP